jgi:hypothetical protein
MNVGYVNIGKEPTVAFSNILLRYLESDIAFDQSTLLFWIRNVLGSKPRPGDRRSWLTFSVIFLNQRPGQQRIEQDTAGKGGRPYCRSAEISNDLLAFPSFIQSAGLHIEFADRVFVIVAGFNEWAPKWRFQSFTRDNFSFRPRVRPSTSFPIHYTQIILSLGAVYAEKL